MKRDKIIFSALVLILASNARGGEAVANESTASVMIDDNVTQTAEVQNALNVLARANLLTRDQRDQKVKLCSDIIEQMRAEGLIKNEYAEPGVFCM